MLLLFGDESMDRMNVFNDENLVHYEGVLGIFDYDPEEFEVKKIGYCEYLHYHGNGKSVNLPDGCIKTRYMFSECKSPVGFSLGLDFDTSRVTDMEHMFYNCKMSEGFTLEELFDTSNVTNMEGMFNRCSLPQIFLLERNLTLLKLQV